MGTARASCTRDLLAELVECAGLVEGFQAAIGVDAWSVLSKTQPWGS